MFSVKNIIVSGNAIKTAFTGYYTAYYALIGIMICLLIFFSYIISKHIVSQLEALTKHIALAKEDRAGNASINLHNPTVEIKHIYEAFRDVISQLSTREAQRDKALQEAGESLKRYQELADMLPQSIFETNAWGNYTYVNKAWYNNFGYSEKDLDEGLNLIETLISGSRDDILGAEKIENSYFVAIRKNGARFPASVYSDNIIINGEITGRRGIIIDITDRIKFIDNLQKETRRAKTADELKSSFLANMSHEIRTPVNSIVGFSNLLAVEQIPDIQKKDFVSYIRSSSEVLLNLIDDIIDIAKIEAGELKINKKECEIKTLFEELLRIFNEVKTNCKKDHLNLICKPDRNIPDLVFRTDPFRLKQILINLISNAIKFTEKGYIEFGYNIREEKVVEFYVRDTGVGMTRSELDLIFERFKRSNSPEKKNIAGTGLGLAISRNLVQLLGGEMWVDSEPLRGTVFFFTLPYLKASSAEALTENTYITEESYNWKGKTILIAEDDLISFNFLRQLLLKTQVSIVRASTGIEAVEFCRSRGKVDLVVMDIQMPEMSGTEATKRIKDMFPDLPVIAQTACAMAGDREKIKLAGCDDYISKPVDIKKFLSMLNYWLKSRAETSAGGSNIKPSLNPVNRTI